MPNGDRTGPNGQGPKTGRGMGFCAGNDSPGYQNNGRGCCGRRLGRGPGMGTGRRNGQGNRHGHGFGRREQ